MHNQLLNGKTVVLTGTTMTTTVFDQIEKFGGKAIAFPLIETKEIIQPFEDYQIEMARNYDWLIFTSQNAVEVFCSKLKRHQLTPTHFRVKVAAVGTKTAEQLEKNGFIVNFLPSVFSADIFVKEFPRIAGNNPRCLFIRGEKAKDTLKNGLPFSINEWTVYETHEKSSNVEPLIEFILGNHELIIIFASPSAVDVFASHIAPKVGWGKVKFASIGHITARRIESYGAKVTYKPQTYTMQAVIEEISEKEGEKQ